MRSIVSSDDARSRAIQEIPAGMRRSSHSCFSILMAAAVLLTGCQPTPSGMAQISIDPRPPAQYCRAFLSDPHAFAVCLAQRRAASAPYEHAATQSTADPDRAALYRLFGRIGNDNYEGGHYLRAGRVEEALQSYSHVDQAGDFWRLMGPTMIRLEIFALKECRPAPRILDGVAEGRFVIGSIFETQRRGTAIAARWYQKAVDTLARALATIRPPPILPFSICMVPGFHVIQLVHGNAGQRR